MTADRPLASDQRVSLARLGSIPVYELSISDIGRSLQTDHTAGLSRQRAASRLRVVGPNALPRRRFQLIGALARRATQALTLILIAATGISLALGEVGDAVLILVVLFLDLALGLLYESFAHYRIQLLERQVPRVAEVVRDGRPRLVAVEELVPGDLVVLRSGERVPADVRLVKVTGLRVDESILTGEPGDQGKSSRVLQGPLAVADQQNLAFAGTTVTTGQARGVVFATGARSILGQLARRVVEAGWQVTPLELRLRQLGQLLAAGISLGSVFLFALGIARGEDPSTMFRTALTLVVAAVPEDLTFILTVALAVGAVRLLSRSVVVRHLTAAETLGDATVVVTDKTGTLTTGAVSLRRLEGIADSWGREQFRESVRHPLVRRVLLGAVAGNPEASTEDTSRGSAVDRALRSALTDAEVPLMVARREYPLFHALAFDERVRYSASLHDDPRSPDPLLIALGAPEVLLPRCTTASDGEKSLPMSTELRASLLDRVAAAAAGGTRVLAVCTRHGERARRSLTHDVVDQLMFLALLHFDDPLRPDAAAAVQELRSAGTEVILATGDHVGTAMAVAQAAGILPREARAVDGVVVDRLTDDALADTLRAVRVVARVDPLQKERIVTVLQRRGAVVAMLGDGVNDAVALRRADLGIAVSTATDVAKDASDLVLLDGGLKVLRAALAEGRRIRETVRTVLAFLFSTNLTELLAVAVSLLVGFPLPFLPGHLLWINVVTDGLADVALALEPAATRPGGARPSARGRIFHSHDWWGMLLTAVAGLVPTLVVFQAALVRTPGSLASARTLAFVTLAATQLFTAFSYRSLDRTIFRLRPFANPWLLLAEAISFALLVVAVHWVPLARLLGTTPLAAGDWVVAIGAALLGFLGVEARKVVLPLFGGPQERTSSTFAARPTIPAARRGAVSSP